MPCGCTNPKYPMRFIGWKDGALIKGAPKLPQGTIRENFLPEASLPHWVLVEPLPAVKKVPEPTLEDSVFEEIEEAVEPTQEDVDVIIGEFEVKDPEVEDVDLMTVKTLKVFIEERGGDVDRGWLKADLVVEARRLEDALRALSVVIDLDPIEGESHTAEEHDSTTVYVDDPDSEP